MEIRIDTNFRKYVSIRIFGDERYNFTSQNHNLWKYVSYEFPKMNDSMIIIFGNENTYSIGQSADNQRSHSEENMSIMSQYACSWPGWLGGYPQWPKINRNCRGPPSGAHGGWPTSQHPQTLWRTLLRTDSACLMKATCLSEGPMNTISIIYRQ